MSSFNDNLASVQKNSDTDFSVTIPEDWLQGRTAFGGLSSAVIVEAMQKVVSADRQLRSMAVSFVGPATPGEQKIALRLLRDGGSVTHIQGELVCDGQVATAVNAAFGKAVANPAKVVAASIPKDLPAPESCPSVPYVEGFTPAFTQHFEMKFVYGQPPLAEADNADYGVWLRFKQPTEISTSSLIAIGDMPPLPGFNLAKFPALGSSLTWYLEFPTELTDIDPEGWWYYDYRCQAAGDGYFNNFGTIWAPDGRAAMFTRQVAMVFQK
ncbi:thioesterase family protein [Spongiibacter sp. KMU-158]|uniref:Thioesterase family protein n=1 Tax=Spongiibacter pelagi TaxID=2760804 RepID=A0A927GWY8_9GAMM|nr:thioesterase family protein [Spongiibacter pelagi]MBD2859608.1 thioesterase family protein [Spongiibacter pelagi]